ncbi:hypothetical protein [Lonsdalea quercina]
MPYTSHSNHIFLYDEGDNGSFTIVRYPESRQDIVPPLGLGKEGG